MPKNDKNVSVTLHVSGSIHQMIVIFSTQVCRMKTSPDSLFHFLKILILRVVGGGGGSKRAKLAQNDKKLSVSIRILGTIPHMIVVFDTDGKMIISLAFFFLFFQNSTFSGFYMGGLCRRAKNDTQLPISVSHTLHSITA